MQTGISKTTLAEFISNKRSLSEINEKKLCEYFGIRPQQELRALSEEEFRFVSEWYHLALLNYIGHTDRLIDPIKVAKLFSISTTELKETITRLEKFSLIVKTAPKTYKRTGNFFKTESQIPSKAIQRFHLQILQKSCHALEELPVTEREFGAVVLPVDEESYDLIKKEIQKFKDKISKISKNSNANSKVSVVSLQFFPLETKDTMEGVNEVL